MNEEYTAKVTRGSTEAEVDWPQRIGVPSIDLDKPALVSGGASVILTKVGEKIKGKITEYSFIPKVREEYTARVTEGSTEAGIDWPQKIGVPQVKLGHPAEATMDATVEITDVGSEICGRIIRYDSIPNIDEKIKINAKRGNVSARSRSYSVELEAEPVASGKATAIVKKKSLPVVAKITEYDIVSEDDVVSAKTEKDRSRVAEPYTGNYEIKLNKEKQKKGFLKSRITRIDSSGVYGNIEQNGVERESNNNSKGPQNPLKSGDSSKNDLISRRQL